MSPPAQQAKAKAQQAPSDVYTAILALALLALTATIVVVILRAVAYFGSFGAVFKVLQPS